MNAFCKRIGREININTQLIRFRTYSCNVKICIDTVKEKWLVGIIKSQNLTQYGSLTDLYLRRSQTLKWWKNEFSLIRNEFCFWCIFIMMFTMKFVTGIHTVVNQVLLENDFKKLPFLNINYIVNWFPYN